MRTMKLTTESNQRKGKDNKSVRCHHNCFECEQKDCVNDVITASEKAEARLRDISYTNYGVIIHQKPTKRKHRGRR